MSAEQIVEYCWWYLEHLHLVLIPATIFDVICWVAIAVYVRRRRQMTAYGARQSPGPTAIGPPLPDPPARA